MNFHVQIFFVNVHLHFSYRYQGVEFLDHKVTVCNFLRDCQTVFQSGCTILYFQQQCMKFLISLQSHEYLLLSVFSMLAFLRACDMVSHLWWVRFAFSDAESGLLSHTYIYVRVRRQTVLLNHKWTRLKLL